MKLETLPAEVATLLNQLIPFEYSAMYLYQNATNWCKNNGFKIAAAYFEKESLSEIEHAKKLQDFLIKWNVMPELPPIQKPVSFTGLFDIIQKAYKIEHDLYEKHEDVSNKILKMGDTCVFDFLMFFRQVQTESVAEYSDMINILQGVDTNDKFKLLMLEENLFE